MKKLEGNVAIITGHPGPFNTRMISSIEKDILPENPVEAQEDFESNIPFSRYAETKEIANLVLFLASDESKYITGVMQVIDGGMMIN